jgi:hypothetical protein
MRNRIKWVKASIEVSNSKDESTYPKVKGIWTAFWLAPKLDKTSSVEEFKKIHKE